MTKKKTTTKKTPKKKKAPKKKASEGKKVTVVNQTIKPELMEHLVSVMEIIEQLPEAVYKGVRNYTISDLRFYARKNAVEVSKAKKKGRKKGQTQATADLDDQVLKAVKVIGKKCEEHKVAMRDLIQELVEYSDQQIRRSLVRLTKVKKIKAEGATKNKTYRVAAKQSRSGS